MEKIEYIQHWNYFCALAERFKETQNFIYHGLEQNSEGDYQLIHGNVYSDNFKQIIILAASEFELVSKAFCYDKGENVNNIIEISNAILKHCPKIVNTEVTTIFWAGKPLSNWKVDVNADKKVQGLGWWNAYNSLKHNEIDSYKRATLDNAFSALATLYIIHLYYMYNIFDNLTLVYKYPPVYFSSKYTVSSLVIGEGLLPDYGDKTPLEVINSNPNNLLKVVKQ